ncbi:MAG: winged helix-turn-helix domain-containing protein [Alphaproteobacteria bacterium]
MHDEILCLGLLRLYPERHRACWRGREVSLTLREYAIVAHMARQPGRDLQYRCLYDVVRGAGFAAGVGAEGYRVNVRAFIKRIRRKFRDIDPKFDAIENYPRFGYRWRSVQEGRSSETLSI